MSVTVPTLQGVGNFALHQYRYLPYSVGNLSCISRYGTYRVLLYL